MSGFNFKIVSDLIVADKLDDAFDCIQDVCNRYPEHPALAHVGNMFNVRYKHKKPLLSKKFDDIIHTALGKKYREVKFYGEKNIDKFFASQESILGNDLYSSKGVMYAAKSGIFYDKKENKCFSSGYFNRRDDVFLYINGKVFKLNEKPPVIEKSGNHFCGVHPNSFNFAHFLIRTLPRIHVYNKVISPDNFNLVYLRSDFDSASFTAGYFDLLNIEKQKIELLHGPSPVFKSNKISFLKSNMDQNQMLLKTVKKEMINKHKNMLSFYRDKKKIYLPRSNRTANNQDDILSILISKGFEILDPSKFSPIQQIAIFMNADQIVAPHGAALANAMFSKRRALVLELMGEDAGHFRGIRDVLRKSGVLYKNIIGKSDNGFGRENFTIDLDKFKSELEIN